MYSDLCKPLYDEIGNVLAGRLDHEIERINKEGGGKREDEGSKGDDDCSDDDAGEGEDREGAECLEDASDVDKIYGAIASGQGNTITNTKADKDNDDEEGRMVVIPQF